MTKAEIQLVRSLADKRSGRDREDPPEYKLKMSFAFCFDNEFSTTEYYHNSSFLE